MSPHIELLSGNILSTTCAALVSPVDCTGAQGAGLAKAIARRWPEQARAYRNECRAGRMSPGNVLIDDSARPWLLFATTKNHWRDPSQIDWVRMILKNLVEAPELRELESIAIPALGCGLGGLSWADVRPLTLAAAERMTCQRVEIYEPR